MTAPLATRAQGVRARLRVETKATIVAQAKDLLATGGLDALSLRRIGLELGMVPSGIHYYFASRDALLGAVIVDTFQEIAAAALSAATSPDPLQAWTSGARAYHRWAMANAELWHLAHSRTATSLKDSSGLLPAKDSAVRALMGPLLNRMPAAVTTEVDPVLTEHLADWARAIGQQPDPARQLMIVRLYTLLHGHVHLAVTGSLPRELLRDETLLDAHLRWCLAQAGFTDAPRDETSR
ncbi:TetR/AcrR family transcriptional regulator [Acidothermaceae bacterium B102]|nr:TetR/AcrR family transcriptional regulator [Acidothermaceae bacterium B102]